MQYRIGEKIKPNELDFNMNNIKKELDGSIQYEIHRKNVDTAKKTACKQLVQYEQFEQLVKGADLVPVKTRELGQLFDMPERQNYTDIKYQYQNHTKNATNEAIEADENKETEAVPKPKQQYVVEQVLDFRDFKKGYDHIYPEKGHTKETRSKESLEQLVMFVKNVEDAYFAKVFGYDFDVKYFIKFINSVNDSIVGCDEGMLSAQEYKFTVDFLKKISELKTFKVTVKGMLKKAEKHLIKHYLQKLVKKELIDQVTCDLLTSVYN